MPTWNNRRLLRGLFLVLFIAAALPCLHAWQQTGKYPDRVWLHRANSLQKWQEFSALSFPIHWYATLHEQLHRPEIDLLT